MNKVKQAGYTLIELLLYVGILGGLLISVSLYFAMTADARIKNQSVTEVDQQGAFAMDTITQVIRNATSITAPTVGNTTTSANFVVPTGSLSPTIFSVNTGVLRIQEGAGSPVPITNSKVSVGPISFQNVTRTGTPGAIQVSFTVSRVNTSGKNEYDYSRTFIDTVALRWP